MGDLVKLAQEALRQQRSKNLALDPAHEEMKVGARISWTRTDGSHHSGVVDDLHTDPTGTVWAFVTISDGTWAAVNVKFARVV